MTAGSTRPARAATAVDHDASPAGLPFWERHPRPSLPALDGVERCDVAVVGLGGSGLACIGALAGRSANVVGVDATRVAGGAAGRNGGFLLGGLAPFHHDAAAVVGRERAARLYRLTLDEIARMAAETPQAVRRVGSLRVAASAEEAEDCARQLAAMRDDGLPVEPYDGPEGRGLLFPEDAVFDPVARCLALAARAQAAGARLYERSPVLDVRAPGGDAPVEVVTARGRVACDAVVVAVDGGLQRLLPELEGTVRTVRLQMLATAPTREVALPRAVYSRWGYDYWQQLPTGEVVLGGCRDVGGAAEWTDEARPTPAVQEALDRLLRDTVGVTAPVVRRWAAIVGYTATGLPIAAEVRPRVWAVGAYSGTGNVLGALCGRAAAAAAAGERPALLELLRK